MDEAHFRQVLEEGDKFYLEGGGPEWDLRVGRTLQAEQMPRAREPSRVELLCSWTLYSRDWEAGKPRLLSFKMSGGRI